MALFLDCTGRTYKCKGVNMKVIENTNPKWTMNHLPHIFNYQKEYSVNVSQEDLNQELENINNGHPANRCSSNMRCFEVRLTMFI